MLKFDAPPSNVCILRLSALGDVTHAIPVLRAMQDQWPDSRITWICAKLEHKLLSEIEGVRFIVVDKKSGPGHYWKLRNQLKSEQFDLMLQMQTSARANLTGACVRAKIKLGWDKGRARDFHRLFMTHAVPEIHQQHQLQGHLLFARHIGLHAEEPRWDYPLRPESIEFARTSLPQDKPILCISPCSSHPWRNWSAERYARVADYAIETHHMAVVLSGGPSSLEKTTGLAIQTAMKNSVTNLIGKDTLPQLAAILKQSDLVISPDSGPAHLANALSTPVIGLHACTWSKRSGPYNSLDLCVDHFAQAARQFKHCEPEDLRWGTRIEQEGVMDLITVDDVTEKIDQAMHKISRG
ncbi:MAG: glycosyltransferase family 9 protein [Pseudomonadota bacterium]